MPTLAYYPFRFYDLVTRKWHQARYRARLPVIAERYHAFQITGRPELRELDYHPDDPNKPRIIFDR